jgi:hypothetical protein
VHHMLEIKSSSGPQYFQQAFQVQRSDASMHNSVWLQSPQMTGFCRLSYNVSRLYKGDDLWMVNWKRFWMKYHH